MRMTANAIAMGITAGIPVSKTIIIKNFNTPNK